MSNALERACDPVVRVAVTRGNHEPPFRLTLQPERDAIRATLAGDLDLATAPELRGSLEELIERGFTRLVIDLRELSFIDVAGLRMLLELDTASRRDGWRLALVPPPPPVRRIFELTGTTDALPFITGDPLSRRRPAVNGRGRE